MNHSPHPPTHPLPPPTLHRHEQEGPEANVHTRWHGKSPTSIAGTVVYIIASLPGKTHVPLPDICRTCGVAEGTIRQIYREVGVEGKMVHCDGCWGHRGAMGIGGRRTAW